MPNLALICFIAAGTALLLYIHNAERDARRDALVENLLKLEQSLRAVIIDRQGDLNMLASGFAARKLDEQSFYRNAKQLVAENPDIVAVALTNEYGEAVWSYPQNAIDPIRAVPAVLEPIQRTARIGLVSSTPPFDFPGAGSAVALTEPAVSGNKAVGAFVAIISLDRLLRNPVAADMEERYQVSFINLTGDTVAAVLDQPAATAGLSHDVAFDPPGYGLRLRAASYQSSPSLWRITIYGLLATLSLAMVWSLWVLRRHMQQRLIAEQALRREMVVRRAMEDSLITGMWAMTLDGRITYVNRAFSEMVGFDPSELRDLRSPMPYWPPEGLARCDEIQQSILRGESPRTGFSMRLMRRNGQRFDVRLYASRLIDNNGRHTGWMASLNDVTELTREREALKASHERFVTLVNGLDALVAVTSRDSGELLLSNRGFREAFDINESAAPLCALPLRHDLSEAELFDPVSQRWYSAHRRELVWVDRKPVWLDIATDITDKKLAAERERQQAERLQQTARLVSMGEMASSLAHELNQPLSAISSYSTACRNLLVNQRLDAEILTEILDKMAAQSRRAGEIIRGIRNFVQRREPKRTDCSVDELLDTVLPLLKAPLSKQGILLTDERGVDLPHLYVDRVLVEQVFFNLIKNAIEAMAETPVWERELHIVTSLQGAQLVIEVSDRGKGISDEEMEKLFQPFFTTKAEGMGMGLNICRSVVEQHQGRLWAEANMGGGTRFTVILPLPAPRIEEIKHAA